MIRDLRKTEKFFATTRQEAENRIQRMIEESDGDIVGQKIDQKEHKDMGTYYEFQVTTEYAKSKSILESGF